MGTTASSSFSSPRAASSSTSAAQVAARVELFRVLGDEDRLRVLALCAEEELTVSELASVMRESQPQLTKKSQPLRELALLASRRDGTRTLLKLAADAEHDPVVVAALESGRALCAKDGSLARVASVVAQREELSRRTFDTPVDAPVVVDGAQLLPMLPMFRALLPGHRLAVDVGTGEGTLLPLLSPLYERVVAVDRSAARLARCALRIEALGLPNVRLRECDVDDAGLVEDIDAKGGADLVVMARVLRHVARPQDAVNAAARLLKRSERGGGHLVIVDALPHDDESVREHGDVWLGFEPKKLAHYVESAGLFVVAIEPLPSAENAERPFLQVAVASTSPTTPRSQ